MGIYIAPKLAMRNKVALIASDKAGCYKCLAIFKPDEVKEWTDQGETALCPQCGIDSVLVETPNLIITEDFLKSVKTFWLES